MKLTINCTHCHAPVKLPYAAVRLTGVLRCDNCNKTFEYNWRKYYKPDGSLKIDKANADLIAAAVPDMLEALEDLLMGDVCKADDNAPVCLSITEAKLIQAH